MTSLGALTTAFAAPASCAASTGIHIVACPGDNCIWWAEGPLNADDCYPPNYNPSLSHYYSPGVCPSGYTPACTSRRTAGDVTETVQTCCPTALGYKYRCVQPTWPWQSSLGCTVYMNEASSTYSFPTVTSIRDGRTVITSTARTELGIGAYGVEIRFQATDFVSSSSSTSTTSGSSTSSTATDTTSTTGSASSSSSASTQSIGNDNNDTGDSADSNSDSAGSNSDSASDSASSNSAGSSSSAGLSSGAAAGVGVGATLGALALVGLGIFFGRRSGQQRRQQEAMTAAGNNHLSPGDKFVTGDGGWYHQQQAHPQELPGVLLERAELQGRALPHEMGS